MMASLAQNKDNNSTKKVDVQPEASEQVDKLGEVLHDLGWFKWEVNMPVMHLMEMG